MRFTTKDKDNDLKNSGNCALDYNSGGGIIPARTPIQMVCMKVEVTHKVYMGGISRTSIFFKAHRDQNSTSMTLFVVVASLSRQQTVASN